MLRIIYAKIIQLLEVYTHWNIVSVINFHSIHSDNEFRNDINRYFQYRQHLLGLKFIIQYLIANMLFNLP